MTHFSQDIQYTVYLELSPYDQIKLPMFSYNLKLGFLLEGGYSPLNYFCPPPERLFPPLKFSKRTKDRTISVAANF